MKNNNKTIWIIVGVVMVLMIGAYFMRSKNVDEQVSVNTPDTSTSAIDNSQNIPVVGTEDISAGSVDAPKTKGVAPVTISYEKALIKYADSRIQLDDQCQASPTNMTFKNNTNIMIDNRSSVSRTIKIGSTFSIKGYGFKIINLYSSKLPATWLVDCGASQNVATILLQK